MAGEPGGKNGSRSPKGVLKALRWVATRFSCRVITSHLADKAIYNFHKATLGLRPLVSGWAVCPAITQRIVATRSGSDMSRSGGAQCRGPARCATRI